MKLVKKFKGRRKQAAGQAVTEQGPFTRRGRTWGIVVDGEEFQLGGQPPPATTKGWGTVPGQDA